MAETSPIPPESPSAGDQSERPRKRLRKGTRSCWECKRRKVGCILETPTSAVCNDCRRRGTACVSQEFPDPPAGTGSRQRAVEDRLGRLEALVEHLVNKPSNDAARTSGDFYGLSRRDGERELIAVPSPRPITPIPGPVPTLASSKYDELSQKLSAAWPSQHDLDVLLDIPDGTKGFHLYKGGCLACDGVVRPRGILRLPPPGSHPVLVARKLLLLSIFLQGAMSSPAQEATGVKPDWHAIMARVVDAARLVTANDDLAGSVEGIECLLMESMYHDAVGNLHRAFLAIRRAITMAQMMGLHRGNRAPNSSEIDPRQLWFRLTQADRYISLVLGLPQGSCDDVFATPKALEDFPPHAAERMRRLDVLAAGLILQRNVSDMYNSGVTREIDKLLRKSAAGLPSPWWRPANLAVFRSSRDAPGVFEEVIRLMDQFVHYHLLAQLHLPYLLCSPANAKDDDNNQSMYSKITAANACRELLTRFVSFHQASPTAHYCRGVDFLAFFATSTLCLAHLEASRQSQTTVAADEDSEANHNSLAFLIHQRPGNRNLMEQAAAGLDEIAGVTQDADVSKMGILLGQLLVMEDDASSRGGSYYITGFLGPISPPVALGPGNEGIEVGEASDDGNSLRIFIPHFGGIEVKRAAQEEEGQLAAFPEAADDGVEEWALPGVDLAFDNLIQGLEEADGGTTELWTGGEQRCI